MSRDLPTAPPAPKPRPRSSRQRFRGFVQDYRQRRLDEIADEHQHGKRTPEPATAADAEAAPSEPKSWREGKRRQYLREYLRWLWPHRYTIGFVFLLAATRAALEMIEPLFMRYIVDSVLLNQALDAAARLSSALESMPGANGLEGTGQDGRRRRVSATFMIEVRLGMADAARDGSRLAKEALRA